MVSFQPLSEQRPIVLGGAWSINPSFMRFRLNIIIGGMYLPDKLYVVMMVV